MSMKLYSVNRQAPETGLKEALFRSLPPDNGLYMPEKIPALPDSFFENIAGLSISEIAYEVSKSLLADDVEWDRISQREFLNIISRETDHLSGLVNDLLDMSRIEAGNLEVRRQVCDLAELVEQAAQRAHPQPGERLHLKLPPDIPLLVADPHRIEVVLRNLIENAAKYSEGAGPITVCVSWDETEMIIRVEDEGPGIPQGHTENIFESFYRVDDGLTRAQPGAGLGLAIAQGFVRAHGGEIWIEPGTAGTTVAFSLPLNGAAA